MTSRGAWWKGWWGRPGWDRFVHIVAAVTFVGAVGVFLALANGAPGGDYLPVETKIMEAMRRGGEPLGGADTAAVVRDITSLGSAVVLILMIVLILGFLLMSGRLRVAALLAIATAGGQALNLGLKNSFERARPNSARHLVVETSTSFPSGHSMASSIFYLTIGALLARTAARRREKTYFVGAALLISFMIGFSRVYLGVHYPTDVLAGWNAGVAWALACWFVADGLDRRGKLRADTGETASA